MHLAEAAPHAEQHRAPPLLPGHGANPAEQLLLGLAAHHAAVEQDHVGVFEPVDDREPRLRQHAGHALGLVDVHLAAPGLDVDSRSHGLLRAFYRIPEQAATAVAARSPGSL